MNPRQRRARARSAGAPPKPARGSVRAGAVGATAAGAILLSLFHPTAAQAQWVADPSRYMASSDETSIAIEAVEGDGPAYAISKLAIGYRDPHPDLPPLDELLPVSVVLTPTETGYVAPRPGQPEETLRFGPLTEVDGEFHASALASIGQAMLGRTREAGLLGIFILPDPQQIEPTSERDLRPKGDTDLRLEVWVGQIEDVRTVATGPRIEEDWRIDNPKHKRILAASPLFPADAGREDTTDLLLEDVLESYVFRLNRHPGREVEASLGPSADETGIALDYRVYEAKPWLAYFTSSNTGTDRTALWQQRVGYQNTQLTSRDDMLSVEYLNAGLDNVNSISVAYSAPWFSPARPAWMRQGRREPAWIRWLDRDDIPWWGLDRLRWGVQGNWSRYEAEINTAAQANEDTLVITNDWQIGGELTYNIFQHRALFVDIFGGIGLRGVNVENQSLQDPFNGHGLVLEPVAGFRLQRVNLFSSVFARFSGGGGFTNFSDEEARLATGRQLVSQKWAVLQWDTGASYYLEPLLNPSGWRDPSTEWSSTLAHELAVSFRGQYAFNYRLIPQAAQVIGGLYSVRGFENGLAAGDSTYVGSVEYRFHIPRALGVRPRPVRLPGVGDFRVSPQQVYGRPDWDLILRGFVDAGATVRNQRELSVSNVELNQTLVGAGVGLELFLGRFVRARVDWGHGLYDRVTCASNALVCPDEDRIDPKGTFHFLFSVSY